MTIATTDYSPAWLERIPPHGSFSQLSTWDECQTRYVIEKAFASETPAWWNIGGSAIHEATAKWDVLRWEHSPDLFGLDALLALFTQEFAHFKSLADEAEPNRTLWRAAKKGAEDEAWWRAMAPTWLAQYAEENGPLSVLEVDGTLAVELGFEIQLGGIVVKGFIDRALIDDRGQILIRDLKFGSFPSDTRQLRLYALALAMQHDLVAQYGDFWNPRKKAGPALLLPPDDRGFFDDAFGKFEEGRRGGNPRPNKGRHCGWCPHKAKCPAWTNTKEAWPI